MDGSKQLLFFGGELFLIVPISDIRITLPLLTIHDPYRLSPYTMLLVFYVNEIFWFSIWDDTENYPNVYNAASQYTFPHHEDSWIGTDHDSLS